MLTGHILEQKGKGANFSKKSHKKPPKEHKNNNNNFQNIVIFCTFLVLGKGHHVGTTVKPKNYLDWALD